MEIRNLISFIQVAEQGSFTRAAATLGYSQSTVSFQIKQLEDELGCLLFERINHTVNLTDSGRELLEYAHGINKLTERFNDSRLSKEIKGEHHILTPDSVCEDMMLANYADFHSKYPDIALKFSTADTAQMLRMLDRNEADIMMTLDTHIYKSDYVIAKEEPVKMCFVVGANSPYAKKRRLSLAEISEYPFILTERGMGYRKSLDEELAKRSLAVTPILEMGRTDIIADMLERGIGVSCLPDFVIREKITRGTLVELNVYDAVFDIWRQLIYHKGKWISRSLDALIEYIKEHEFEK